MGPGLSATDTSRESPLEAQEAAVSRAILREMCLLGLCHPESGHTVTREDLGGFRLVLDSAGILCDDLEVYNLFSALVTV